MSGTENSHQNSEIGNRNRNSWVQNGHGLGSSGHGIFRRADALAKRPQLRAALDACRKQGATLVIGKLDRLARNVHFVSGLMESKVKFVACDMPEANELTIHIMPAFAEHEAKRISQRTKDALALAKGRGLVLGKAGAANLRPNIEAGQIAADGFASRLHPMFEDMKTRGLSQRGMAEELNRVGVRAATGGRWMLAQVQRVIRRIERVGIAEH